MKTISFAQNHEDILLRRAFGGGEGFYIDVGACHPVFQSVTKLFYDRGWRGINIEPIPATFEILAQDRVRDVNLPVGISDREGTLQFFEVPAAVGYSTFSLRQAEEVRRLGYEMIEHAIPVTTLARVCEQHAVPDIDFLKIDAESHEREVLAGADWARFRPRVVLIEATRPEEWESLILSADYLYATFDGLNRYYVRAEDRDLVPLLAVPVNVLDEFESFEHRMQVQELERRVQELELWIGELLGTDGLPLAPDAAGMAGSHGTRGQLASMRAEIVAARARLEAFEGWGPTTIGVVRRLRRVSARFPLATSMLKRAMVARRVLWSVPVGGSAHP